MGWKGGEGRMKSSFYKSLIGTAILCFSLGIGSSLVAFSNNFSYRWLMGVMLISVSYFAIYKVSRFYFEKQKEKGE